MRLRTRAALATTCFFAFACKDEPKLKTASISGIVKDAESGALLANVVISKSPPTPAETLKSAPDGTFVFPVVEVGVTFTLSAETDNYDGGGLSVTTVEGDNPVHFELRRKRVCTPGETRCAPDMTMAAVIKCSDDGTQYISTPCGMGQICQAGSSTVGTACITPINVGVMVGGDGAMGSAVTSVPLGISCPPTCSMNVPLHTSVTFTAVPVNSIFNRWQNGACNGQTNTTCTFTAEQSGIVTAAFLATAYTITVQKRGGGVGHVTSVPMGISCPNSCVATFPRGTMMTLTASVGANSVFGGWGGDCMSYGMRPSCILAFNTTHNVTASFLPPAQPFTVTTMGTGMGTVTSNPAGITCGATCMHSFRTGSMVTLTAAPDMASGLAFTGWGGDCSGVMPTCTLTADMPHNVSASFDTNVNVLAVMKLGTGAGTITSTPAAINCGASCSAGFAPGTMVTLTAHDNGVSIFRGWGGDCMAAGTNPTCLLTMDMAHNASATFDPAALTLTVNLTGTGAGTVTSAPAGISCGATCVAPFGPGTMVTLTAMPTAGSTFSSWTGCASMSGPSCMVTMNAAHTVSASFDAFYASPLAADANCTTLIHFDAPTPLAQGCGGGAAATQTGTWSSVPSRTAALGTAIEAGGASEEAWIDLMKNGPALPTATVEMTIFRIGDAFNGAPAGVLYSDQPVLAPSKPGFVLAVQNDGTLTAATFDGAGGTTAVQSASGVIATNQWHHVAATLSQTAGITLFVDGAQSGQTAGALLWTASSSTAWAGAARQDASGTNATEHWNGRIDELRVSNVVRY